MTVEQLRRDFKARMKVWRASDCRKQVCQILDRQTPDEGWNIEHAVCMASGSFSRENLENRKRSGFQFVAFVDMVNHLQEEGKAEIRVVAQEPAFTEVDRLFLADIGVEVCQVAVEEGGGKEDGSAGSRVTDYFGPSSFVCELFMERQEGFLRDLLQAEAKLVLSSIMTARWWMRQYRKAVDEDTTLDQVVSHDYQKYRMPRFDDDPNIFEGLCIFSRRPAEDDDEDG